MATEGFLFELLLLVLFDYTHGVTRCLAPHDWMPKYAIYYLSRAGDVAVGGVAQSSGAVDVWRF
jgi:hypothetical protein